MAHPLSRLVTLLLAVALAVAIGSAHGAARGEADIQTPPPTSQSVPEFMQWYRTQPRVTLPIDAQGAAVLVVKFTDLQCPACALTHQAYKPVFAKYQTQFPGAVRLVVKDYPLNRDCNPKLARTLHVASCDAAVAVRLARRQGTATELEDWLYANQQLLTPETVRKAANVLAGVNDFDASYPRLIENVKADAALGESLGVTSTPTFFINGVKVPKVMEPPLLEAAIAYELQRAGKTK